MKAVGKKRGWVYRGTLICTSAFAIFFAGIWLASYIWWSNIYIPSGRHTHYRLSSSRGSGVIAHGIIGNNESFAIESILLAEANASVAPIHRPHPPHKGWLEFEKSYYPTSEYWIYMFPLWIPMAAMSIWPTAALIRSLIERPGIDHCTVCDYDLRGSPSGVCPECGAKTI